MLLQVRADSGQVGPQLLHLGVLAVTLMEDVTQVEVQDVGMETAHLQVMLREHYGMERTRGGDG